MYKRGAKLAIPAESCNDLQNGQISDKHAVFRATHLSNYLKIRRQKTHFYAFYSNFVIV